MLLPGIDMLRLFFKRFLNRQNPFKGDRNHLHHYLSTKYGIYISNVIIQSLILLLALKSISPRKNVTASPPIITLSLLSEQ